MLNKTSNWPGVLHLHMAELEIIRSLGLVPRLAGPGKFAWRADTLSRARIPHRFLFGFYFFFFVQTVSQKLFRDTSSLIHKNRVALRQLKAAAFTGNVCQDSNQCILVVSKGRQQLGARSSASSTQPAL